MHREEQASRESKAGEGKCRAESWDTFGEARIVAKRVKSFKKKSVFPNTLSLEQSRRGEEAADCENLLKGKGEGLGLLGSQESVHSLLDSEVVTHCEPGRDYESALWKNA